MAIVRDNNKLTIEANGQSDVVELHEVDYKVFVRFVGSASGTLTLLMGDKEDEMISVPTPNGAGGYEATLNGSKVFEMTGGGLVGFSGATISGTIEVTFTEVHV